MKKKLNPNARKWVRALRSGEYQQCTSILKSESGFCCLGVACDLYIKSKLPEYERISASLDIGAELMPDAVCEWFGLSSSNGGGSSLGETLAALNDNGKTFPEIADIIESQPEGLFVK